VAIVFKPSTLLNFHHVLVQRKYRLLFSPKQKTKPGPKGANRGFDSCFVETKQRNPTWGCPRIAEQINLALGTAINKDVVRRILEQHYRPIPTEGGPSWLTFIGQMRDSLWSLDLFRCESIALQTYWVLVVMDQYTRRIIGFGVQSGVVDGMALCRDVQAGDPRRGPSKLSQFRSRSTVSVSSMASEPKSSVSRKSKRFPILHGPIHLSSD
jgi:hypothetical protein